MKLAVTTDAGKVDVIVVSEVSRLARSTLQLLEISRECIVRGVHQSNAKTEILFEDTTQSMIVTMVQGLVVEIERYLISSRAQQ